MTTLPPAQPRATVHGPSPLAQAATVAGTQTPAAKNITSAATLREIYAGTSSLSVAEILPAVEPRDFGVDDVTYLKALTSTPEGEARLMQTLISLTEQSPAWHKELVDVWIGLVENDFDHGDGHGLSQTPLMQSIRALAKGKVIVPRADLLRMGAATPWGGQKIRESLAPALGIPATGDPIGEAIVVSGHRKYMGLIPMEYAGYRIDVPMYLLAQWFPLDVLGRYNTMTFGPQLPYMLKLLNSGSWTGLRQELATLLQSAEKALQDADSLPKKFNTESFSQILDFNNHHLHMAMTALEKAPVNPGHEDFTQKLRDLHRRMLAMNLSVQIHPTQSYCEAHPEKGYHSKTEAWHIKAAEKGAGIYLGFKPGVTEDQVEAVLRSGEDPSDLMIFTEVKADERYPLPSGTVHAIGAGIQLYEPQESSDTTLRYYDWGRPRELHINDAIATTNWDAQGQAFVDSLRRTPVRISGGSPGQALHEVLVWEKEFSYDRLTFKAGDAYTGDTSNGIQSLWVTSGSVTVFDAEGQPIDTLGQGQPIHLLPAQGKYTLRAEGEAMVKVIRSDERTDLKQPA